MKILQIISGMPRRTIRCLSLANLTIPLLICSFLGSDGLVQMMLFDVCISISIVLMISDIYNDWQTSLTFASFTFLVSVVLSVAFSMGVSTIMVSLGYVFVASFPLALCLTIRTIRVMKDIGFLTIEDFRMGNPSLPYKVQFPCLLSGCRGVLCILFGIRWGNSGVDSTDHAFHGFRPICADLFA